MFIVLPTKLSKRCSLQFGGTDLFLTSHSSYSSMPSKFSTSRNLQVNSDISFAISCGFTFWGVRVYLDLFLVVLFLFHLALGLTISMLVIGSVYV